MNTTQQEDMEDRATARRQEGELQRALRLAAKANHDVGRDATGELLTEAADEIMGMQIALDVCVDRGSFEMVCKDRARIIEALEKAREYIHAFEGSCDITDIIDAALSPAQRSSNPQQENER